ncbi:460a4b3d-e4ef-48da-904e-177eb2500b3c [Thermothielavioides terrestris]|uniref:Tetratricopeptide repeat protein 36 n=2 Tax=Thermothielavioides terrestris TaxID=2587410 RepID=G2RHT4_THETT|nr:uncharacterized protein THITE_2171583 [Thermothielavioides terrestris NRRL 8126]AEO71396.1 hypothetical protein THITE_2171583 [Thermothielavioides terrestris NRRL 8126]SPQ27627.1 460a4b3d-e4ef-48da-904e-177eb2500b3c [Thermothielavioides terrestris]
MAYLELSRRDINVLEKIKDPESDPSLMIQVDPTLPKDPHITDADEYQKISQLERDIILSFQDLEVQQAKQRSTGTTDIDVAEKYRDGVSRLDQLIQDHPQYASARNNRAQALRRLYGDSMLVAGAPRSPQALLQEVDDAERSEIAKTVLGDLDCAISLLTPKAARSRVSPQVARTLANAHTQRAAVYLMTSKLMGPKTASVDVERPEASWSKLEFEERASRDFALGGRYGNEIAKGLAVSTNPTAKLCGQMVREAMKKEYGPGFAS